MSKSPDTFNATIKVKLKAWRAPNFAVREGSDDSDAGIPVRELDEDTLEDMALAWVRDLYMKAGRPHAPFYKPAKSQ